MKKRLLLLLGVLIALPALAQTFEYEYKGKTLVYDIIDEHAMTCRVGQYNNNLSGHIEIPAFAVYNGIEYHVTSIGVNAFRLCESITSVVIPSSVTSIEEYAFNWCSSLTSVEIPNSVTSIGENAFSSCNSLPLVVIPNSITSIANNVFSYCSSLTSVEIPNSVTSIGYSAFSNCSSLLSVEIPNSVTSIGDYSFSHCSSLTSVVIPNSVTSISNYTFEYCTSLASVDIPDSVTSIGDGAFQFCTSLASVEIPNSVTTMTTNAFNNCTSLSSVQISNSLTTLSNGVFSNCISLTSVEIPNSVISMGNGTFQSCTSLVSVEIPNSVTSIGVTTFEHCTSLVSIDIPNSVTSIGDLAFSYCISLVSVEIPNSVTSICYNAFSYCDNLISVTIPDSVSSIGDGAFGWCSALTSVIIPNSVTYMGDIVFSNCTNLTAVSIGTSVTSIGFGAFADCTSLTSIVIPNSVKFIGANAFKGCNGLSTIIMGNDVMEIGEKAFDGSPATNVSITAQTPPTAPDNTFSNYTGRLYLQGQQAIEAYHAAPTCWNRFNSCALIEPTEMKCQGPLRYNVKPGANIQLSVTLLPEDVSLPQVFWYSTNPEVATVDYNGLVSVADDLSSVEAGERNCKIIAESLYAGGPVIEFLIDTESTDFDVTCITLNKTEVTVFEGETVLLTATVTPTDATDKTLTWTSSDESVATVAPTGIVTAIHAGTAVITATTSNGLEAICEVTVVAKVIEPTDITLNFTNTKILEGETVQLTATVAPADATDQSVVWSSNDATIAAVDQTGLVSGLKVGIAVITATTANGLTAECVVTVDEMTGIDDIDAEISVDVRDHTIIVTAPYEAEVEVFSTNGSRVALTREHRIEILVDGVYIVRVADRIFKVVVR